MSNVLLGVTGGIAAYKAATLARLLIKSGHKVRVMMTDCAEQFIGPTALSAITGYPVFKGDVENSPLGHIELASWADICVVAPATANIIGKLASGIADNPLSTTLLAVHSPLLLAPAMNLHMYAHPAVRENIAKLKSWGLHIIEPADGELACGDTGKGRMQEPEIITDAVNAILGNSDDYQKVRALLDDFQNQSISEYLEEPLTDEDNLDGMDNTGRPLEGLRVLVSAGPTREYIDPVRYISNRSSGKMGYAVADAAYEMGAKVTLVSGDVSIVSKLPNIVNIHTAEEMFEALQSRIADFDILIMAAAVADYAPENKADEKIKKSDDTMTLELVKTTDILSALGGKKTPEQVFVGFAAETENIETNALKKLEAKNLDIIVANDVSKDDIGFDSDYNDVKLYFRDGSATETGKRLKSDIAKIIVTEAAIIASKKRV